MALAGNMHGGNRCIAKLRPGGRVHVMSQVSHTMSSIRHTLMLAKLGRVTG